MSSLMMSPICPSNDPEFIWPSTEDILRVHGNACMSEMLHDHVDTGVDGATSWLQLREKMMVCTETPPGAYGSPRKPVTSRCVSVFLQIQALADTAVTDQH